MVKRYEKYDKYLFEGPIQRFFRKLTRTIIGLVVFVVVLCGVLVVFAPNILSTDWGRDRVEQWINRRIPGRISIDSISLSWMGDQYLQGVELQDPEGRRVVRATELLLETGLWEMLTTRERTGRVTVTSPQANIVYDGESTNLQKALGQVHDTMMGPGRSGGMKSSSDVYTLRIPFTGVVVVNNGEVELSQPREEPVIFSELTLRLQASSRAGPLMVFASGKSSQGGVEGQFDVEMVLKGFNRQGELQIVKLPEGLVRTGQGAEIGIRADIQQLPVQGLDALWALRYPKQRGLLTAALGKQLVVNSTITINSQDLLVDLKAGSPTFQTSLQGHTQGGIFYLDKAGETTFTMTPAFFKALGEYLPIPASVGLMQTTVFTFNVKRLEVPFSEGDIDLARLAFNGDITVTETVLQGDEKFGRLKMSDIAMQLSSDALGQGADLSVATNMDYNEFSSAFTAKAVLTNLLDKGGLFNFGSMRATVSIDGKELPVNVLDEWMSMDGMLVEALGDRLNFHLETTTQVGDPIPQITLSLSSRTFQSQDAVFIMGDRLKLQGELPFQYELAGSLVNRFVPAKETFRVRGTIPLKGVVKQLSFPAPWVDNPQLALQDVELNVVGEAGDFQVEGLPQVGAAQLSGFKGELSGPNLAAMQVKGSAKVVALDKETWLVQAGGDTYDLAIDTGLRFAPDGQIQLVGADFAIRSTVINSKMKLDFKSLDDVTIKEPLTTTYQLNAQNAALLGLGQLQGASIVEPGTVTVTVDPFSLSVRDFNLPTAQLKGQMRFDHLGVRLPDSDQIVRLKDADVKWEVDAPSNSLKFILEAGAGEGSGKVNLKAQVLNWLAGKEINAKAAKVGFNLTLDKVPTATLEILGNQKGLQDILGPIVDGYVAAELESIAPPNGPVAFELKGDDLEIKGAVVVDQLITLANPDRPISLLWKITPKRYQQVRQGLDQWLHGKLAQVESLQLEKPTTLKGVISRLGFPAVWINPAWTVQGKGALPGRFDPSLAALSFTVDFSDLSLREPNLNQQMAFDQLRVVLDAPSFSQTINYSLIANGKLVDFDEEMQRHRKKDESMRQLHRRLEQQGYFEDEIQAAVKRSFGKTEVTQIIMQGTLADFVNAKGEWQPLETSLNLQGVAQQVPVAILGEFLHVRPDTQEKILAFFGNSLNLDVKAQWRRLTGPLSVTVNSSNTKGKFVGEMVDGHFFLKEKALVRIPVTPELAKHVLQYINPLVASTQSADQELVIEVEPLGVEIPLLPELNIAQANLGETKISMGHLRLRNRGAMKAILKLLKLSRLNTMEELDVWFTPLYLSMKNGVLEVKRMDFLVADYFHLATWGRVDFRDRRLAMMVGFTAEALRNAFSIKGLPPEYMLSVPIRGDIDKPRVNEKHAFGRLMTLYAQAYAGEKGRLLAGIVDSVIEGDRAPQPTTIPVPWVNRDPLRWGEPDFFPEEDHPANAYQPKSEFEIERVRRKAKDKYRDFRLRLKL